MFGEAYIHGSKVIKKDDKNRIHLPEFTYAEKNDKLGLLLDDELKTIYVMTEADLDAYKESLLKKYSIFDDIGLSREQVIVKRKIHYFTEYVKAICQSRIVLPERFIEHLQLSDNILAVGEGNKLALCKDLNTYFFKNEDKKSL